MTDRSDRRPFFQHPELDGESFFLPAGRTGILLLHGFTATTVEVRPLANRLHQGGFTVSAPLLPGHGTSPDDLNKKTWRDWVETAEKAYRGLTAQCEVTFVAGESMGALLSLHLAATFPAIRGILLYAPAVRIPRIWLSVLAAPFISIREKTYATNEDPACYPWQGYTVLPVRAVAQLYRLQRHVRQILPIIRQPVRIFQGLEDHTVDPQGAHFIYDRIGSVDKELYWFAQSGHCVILDRDFDRIVNMSLGFLNQTG